MAPFVIKIIVGDYDFRSELACTNNYYELNIAAASLVIWMSISS